MGNDWSLSGVSGPNTCTLNLSYAHNLEQFLLKIIPNQTGKGTLGHSPNCFIFATNLGFSCWPNNRSQVFGISPLASFLPEALSIFSNSQWLKARVIFCKQSAKYAIFLQHNGRFFCLFSWITDHAGFCFPEQKPGNENNSAPSNQNGSKRSDERRSVHSCHNGSVRSGGGPGAGRRSVYFLTAAAAVAKV